MSANTWAIPPAVQRLPPVATQFINGLPPKPCFHGLAISAQKNLEGVQAMT